MIRKIYGCLLLVLALTYQVYAQAPKNSLLWEISGNGLKQPSWIFGTFHIMCKPDFTISSILSEKIKTATAFYGELKMDDPGMQASLAMKMMMPDQSLEKMIGEKDYANVSAAFNKITGMQLKMLDHFKPFMAESMLALKMVACAETVQPETEFVNIAKQHKIPLSGLETIDDQLGAIEKQPLDSQVHDLTQTVLNYDSVKNVMKQMLAIYKLNNADSIYGFMKASGTGGDFEVNMLVNRNRKWIPLIEKAMRTESVFFAVGAGHLGGPDGVISLLRKHGYKLTPVKY